MDLFSLLASAMISFLAAYLFLPWLILRPLAIRIEPVTTTSPENP